MKLLKHETTISFSVLILYLCSFLYFNLPNFTLLIGIFLMVYCGCVTNLGALYFVSLIFLMLSLALKSAYILYFFIHLLLLAFILGFYYAELKNSYSKLP